MIAETTSLHQQQHHHQQHQKQQQQRQQFHVQQQQQIQQHIQQHNSHMQPGLAVEWPSEWTGWRGYDGQAAEGPI